MRCKDPSCHDHATFTSNEKRLELSAGDARLQLRIESLEKVAHSWTPGRVCRCWNRWDIDICYMWSLSRNYEDYNNESTYQASHTIFSAASLFPELVEAEHPLIHA